jgi:hypothetical protein
MGSDMALRLVFLPHGYPPHRTNGLAAVDQIIDGASIVDLRAAFEEYEYLGLLDTYPIWEDVRRDLKTLLKQRLDEFVNSLNDRDVDRLTFGGVAVYGTGGGSWGDSPTQSYETWDFMFGDVMPEPWQKAIGSALGLLTPVSDPNSTTVQFLRW